MPSNPARQQQWEDFDKFKPALEPSLARAAAGPDGEVVSGALLAAISGGAVLKLATKTKTFGPFHLTPAAVSGLVQRLNEMPQISR
jgi:hypothetical protein